MTPTAYETPALPAHINERIREVYYGNRLSEEARDVLRVLVSHERIGIDRAMTIEAIRKTIVRADLKARTIKAAVKELVETHWIPVGASRTGTPGYFLIADPREAQATIAAYVSEIKSLAHRIRVLCPEYDLRAELDAGRKAPRDGSEN